MGKFLFPIHRVFSIILIMPLFIQVFHALGISTHLNLLLLFIISIYMFAAVLFNYENIRVSRLSIVFFIFLVISIVRIIDISRILPIMFFLQCFLLSLFIHYEKFSTIFWLNKKVIYWTCIMYIGISLVLLVFNLNYDPYGRFYGLGYSPTTFVLYLVVFISLFHYIYKSSLSFYVLFGISIVLTYFSGTRTGLLLLLLLPINNYFYDNYIRSKKRFVHILLILFIICVYPLTDIISVANPELLEYRMTDDEGTVDNSYATRIALTADVVNEWLNGEPIRKVSGFGTEFSRMTIIKIYKEDHQLHNDFLRFMVDFGIPAVIPFIVIIYSLSKNNKYSFFLMLIYLFSFYHNLIYEVFFFNTLLFMSRERTEPKGL